jgi:hypothetical protein
MVGKAENPDPGCDGVFDVLALRAAGMVTTPGMGVIICNHGLHTFCLFFSMIAQNCEKRNYVQ